MELKNKAYMLITEGGEFFLLQAIHQCTVNRYRTTIGHNPVPIICNSGLARTAGTDNADHLLFLSPGRCPATPVNCQTLRYSFLIIIIVFSYYLFPLRS